MDAQISASSAALDLAHLSQTSPRSSFSGRANDAREKSSEWPQYGHPRVPENLQRSDNRRTVTNPTLTLSSALEDHANSPYNGTHTPHTANHSQSFIINGMPSSRHGTPPVTLDNLSINTRSVPATPLGVINGAAAHLLKTPGTPDSQGFGTRVNSQGPLHEGSLNAGDLQASLSRLPPGQYDNSGLSPYRQEDPLQVR